MSKAGRGRTCIFSTPDIHSQITLILNGLVRVSLCRQNRQLATQNQNIQLGQRAEQKRKAQLEDQNEATNTIESQIMLVS